MSACCAGVEGDERTMEMYLHDNPAMFRFVLYGDLTGGAAPELEHAWNTARSILNGRDLVIDVSGIEDADEFGVELLSRMRDSGARLTAVLPPKSERLLRSLGLPVAVPSGPSIKARVLSFFNFAGLRKLLAEVLVFEAQTRPDL